MSKSKKAKKEKRAKRRHAIRIPIPPGEEHVKCSKETLKRLKLSSQPLPRKNGLYSAPLTYLCPSVVRAHVVRLSPKIMELMGAGGPEVDKVKVKKTPPPKKKATQKKSETGGDATLKGQGQVEQGQGGAEVEMDGSEDNKIPGGGPIILEGGPLNYNPRPRPEFRFKFPNTAAAAPPPASAGVGVEEDVKVIPLPDLISGNQPEIGNVVRNEPLPPPLPRGEEEPMNLEPVKIEQVQQDEDDEVQVVATHHLTPVHPGFADELNEFITNFVLGDDEVLPDIRTDFDWEDELDDDNQLLQTEEVAGPSGRRDDMDTLQNNGNYSMPEDMDSDLDILELMIDPRETLPLPAM